MDIVTAKRAEQEKLMTIFTIDSENNITAYASQSEITDKEAEQFTSEKDLAQLAADWPGNRLVEVWNGIPGLTRVKKFTNRSVAMARIWKAVQSLGAGQPSGDVGPKRGHTTRKPARKQQAHTGRKNTKQAQVVALLKRSSGATLQHLMRATGWQAHSVRGFISGALGKRLKLKIESFKTERGERAYRIG
jgi:Protein of unknown function (DUF3489)